MSEKKKQEYTTGGPKNRQRGLDYHDSDSDHA